MMPNENPRDAGQASAGERLNGHSKYSTFSSVAPALARLGFSVFALGANSKKPAIAGGNGCHDATRDPATLDTWGKKYPRANTGIATGRELPTGGLLLCIESDTYKPDYDAATVAGWNLPPTLTARSAHGGTHPYYRYAGILPCVNENVLAQGVCVKATGGYMVAPGSVVDGLPYTWVDPEQPIAELPERIAEMIRNATARPEMPPRPTQSGHVPRGDAGDYWLTKALARTGQGSGDPLGYWLAQQLLIEEKHGASVNVRAVLQDYGAAATLDPSDPFTPRDVERWIASASRSRLVQFGEPARSATARSSQPRQEKHSDDQEQPHAAEDPAADEEQPKGAKRKLPLTKMLADAIEAAGEHFAKDASRSLWVFRHGVYQPNGEAIVKELVRELLTGSMAMPEAWSRRQADEVVEFITVGAPALWERPPLEKVNLLNGILDLPTRTLTTHSPDFLSPVQLPVNYDPQATCPHWERFVATAFPEDARALAWEIPAWLMTPNTSIQKAVLAIGEGGNGKSRWLRGLQSFLGKSNTSAATLQKIEADRFSAARLYGKMANISADLPDEALSGTSMFKAITGGDEIQGEHKYRAPFNFTPYARLLFSANTPPKSPDGSQGFYDRWLVIPFAARFRGEHGEIGQVQLDKQLADPRELSGLLNKALAAMPQVLTGRLSESDTTRAALGEFRSVTDPFAIWLDVNTVTDLDTWTPSETLRGAYIAYCQEIGRTPPTPNTFTRLLKKHAPHVERSQRRVDGNQEWGWTGIRLRSPEEKPPSGKRQKSSPLSPLSPHSPYSYSTREEKPPSDMGMADESESNRNREKLVTVVTPVTPDAQEVLPSDGAEAAGDGCQHLRPTAPQPSGAVYCAKCGVLLTAGRQVSA